MRRLSIPVSAPQSQVMRTYRFRVQGAGLDEDGEPIGFFSTRQIRAASLEEGRIAAEEDFEQKWREKGKTGLSQIDHWKIIDGWTLRWPELRRNPKGFVFYRGDGAEEAALGIEIKAFGRIRSS